MPLEFSFNSVKFLRVGTLDSAGISSVSEVSSTFSPVSVYSVSPFWESVQADRVAMIVRLRNIEPN